MADKERFYAGKRSMAKGLADNIDQVFKARGYETQMVLMTNETTVVQIKKGGTLRTVTGTSEVVSVSLEGRGNDLIVKVGEAKWVDKIGAGAVSLVVLWPLALTAGYGTYRQYQLINEVWSCVNNYMMSQGSGQSPSSYNDSYSAPEQKISSGALCHSCHGFVPEGSRFCPECGAPAALCCTACGAAIDSGMRFCPNCGKKVE